MYGLVFSDWIHIRSEFGYRVTICGIEPSRIRGKWDRKLDEAGEVREPTRNSSSEGSLVIIITGKSLGESILDIQSYYTGLWS